MPGSVVAVVSFRLGLHDGVSVEAAKWCWALRELGYRVETVAGEGPVDHLLPGLAIDAPLPPGRAELEAALAGAELVVVENLCSLPLNPPAAELVASVLRGRRAILHHHDLPSQRPAFAAWPPPPDDPAWTHVVINELSRRELAEAGIEATVVRNTFATDPPSGDRERTRAALGVGDTRLLLQPTRALARKNVAGGLALADKLGARYWLLGPAEDGYGPELDRLLAETSVEVLHGYPEAGCSVADAYAAADAVVLPSTWEGFGNPTVESALARRPLAVGPYPVAAELAAFGFRWFAIDDAAGLEEALEQRDPAVLDHNQQVARQHFALAGLPATLSAVLGSGCRCI